MPLFEENNQTNPNQTNSPVSTASSGLFTLPDSVMKLVPWIPFILEATTGQKIPQLGGTMGEIQSALQQLQINQTQLLTNQQQLASRLMALETNANNHLTNLTHQFNSLRLTHTRETKLSETQKKEIDFNPNPNQIEEY